MADFILHRNISVDTYPPYPFPTSGATPIYGNGKFYNGFSIGDTSNLTVVNRDGVLKFSRGAASAQEETSVILGTIKKNSNRTTIYIDIASPLSQSMTSAFKIGKAQLSNLEPWTTAKITHTDVSDLHKVQNGGVLSIFFKSTTALPAIPDLLAVRAIWLYG